MARLGRQYNKAQSLPQCAHYNDTTIWLRRADVRKALNIPDSLPPYDSCSEAVTDNYIVQYTDMSQSVKKVVSAGVRVLLFVGDVDTVCNVMHTKQFADQLGLDLLNASYPWTFDDTLPSVAGYRTAYRGLDLLTVRGAGHFVSSQFEKPRETQQMIYNFVNNHDYSQSSGLNTNPQPTSPQPTSPQPTTTQSTSSQPTSPQPTTTQSTSSQPTSPQPTSPQPTSPQPTSSQTTSEQGHGSAAGGSRQQSPWEILSMKSLYCCLFIIGRVFASVN
uniref:Uncharacterized protein n=1 Tax=Plectus sambesii TaxID=2011161 RepID=A0A914UX70_9BILA